VYGQLFFVALNGHEKSLRDLFSIIIYPLVVSDGSKNTNEEHKNCIQNFDEESSKRQSERPKLWAGRWVENKLSWSLVAENVSELYSVEKLKLHLYRTFRSHCQRIDEIYINNENARKQWHIYITEVTGNRVLSAC
jgi:hypothetical protein